LPSATSVPKESATNKAAGIMLLVNIARTIGAIRISLAMVSRFGKVKNLDPRVVASCL
jgi:hypothetical protein